MAELIDGEMTGAEVDILRVLQEKYEFDLDFFTAAFSNVEVGEMEEVVGKNSTATLIAVYLVVGGLKLEPSLKIFCRRQWFLAVM